MCGIDIGIPAHLNNAHAQGVRPRWSLFVTVHWQINMSRRTGKDNASLLSAGQLVHGDRMGVALQAISPQLHTNDCRPVTDA
jgi:hypothetical protein